jgi:hypothetical protein
MAVHKSPQEKDLGKENNTLERVGEPGEGFGQIQSGY